VANYVVIDKLEETICRGKWYKLVYFNIIVSVISLVGSTGLLLAVFKYTKKPIDWNLDKT